MNLGEVSYALTLFCPSKYSSRSCLWNKQMCVYQPKGTRSRDGSLGLESTGPFHSTHQTNSWPDRCMRATFFIQGKWDKGFQKSQWSDQEANPYPENKMIKSRIRRKGEPQKYTHAQRSLGEIYVRSSRNFFFQKHLTSSTFKEEPKPNVVRHSNYPPVKSAEAAEITGRKRSCRGRLYTLPYVHGLEGNETDDISRYALTPGKWDR